MKTPSVFKFNTSYAYRKASAFGLVLGLVFLTSCAGNLFLPFNKFARTPQPTLGTQPPVNPPAQKDFLEQTFAGYQGWFTTQGLSFNNNWTHWAGSSSPSPTNITFELYPELVSTQYLTPHSLNLVILVTDYNQDCSPLIVTVSLMCIFVGCMNTA